MSNFTESDVEEAALYYFEQLGYTVLGGAEIAPGEPGAERSSYADVVLVDLNDRNYAIETCTTSQLMQLYDAPLPKTA